VTKNCCVWNASKNRDLIKPKNKMNRKIKGNRGKIYVANLPFETGEPELKSLFSNAGDVMSVNSVKDKQTDQPRGFAFVPTRYSVLPSLEAFAQAGYRHAGLNHSRPACFLMRCSNKSLSREKRGLL